jgi:hypothetical protein
MRPQTIVTVASLVKSADEIASVSREKPVRRKKTPSVSTIIPAASPADLQRVQIALGEKPLTPMEKIIADKKWILEPVKQIKSTERLNKTVWEQASELVKQQEEKARWHAPSESDEDDAPRIVYSLESCDYEEGDELGDEEDQNATAKDNGTPPAKKKAVDLYPDAKVHFQYHQFDPGLKREGVTMACSLPDHIWTALQAIVGPMPAAPSLNRPMSYKEYAQSVIGNSDNETNPGKGKLGFHLERSYKTLNASSRKVTPENAWVFSEERFRDFIVRLIKDDKIALYERDPDNPLGVTQLFKHALKAWFNLFFFYRVHGSDLAFSETEGLSVPEGLWCIGADGTDVAARKMHRKRLLRDGLELYGQPPDWKPLDPNSLKRSQHLWPLFERIRHQVVK